MNQRKQPVVYILSNKKNGTLYIGMTTSLSRRLEDHLSPAAARHVKKYGLNKLVYVEAHETIAEAGLRERRVKRWLRPWKIELIESLNPEWKDLSKEWLF